MPKQVMIPFEVTATNLNLIDTTEKTLVTFSGDGLIRVPTRLELRKDAGTAYAITFQGSKRSERRLLEPYQQTLDSYSALFRGGANLVIESWDDDSRGRPHIFIPEEGFLDVATAQTRLVFPFREGHVLRGGATKFILRSTANLASGTGSLFGRFYFDEYTVGGF